MLTPTTAREIITDAYRENNIIALGTEPNELEFAEGLRRLRNIQASLFGQIIGLFLIDWEFPSIRRNPEDSRFPLHPSDTTVDETIQNAPPQNSRVILPTADQDIVYFAQNPDDGAQMEIVCTGRDLETDPLTVDANSRSIIAGASSTAFQQPQPSIQLSENFTGPRRWFYRGDLGTWVEVSKLRSLDDTMFLPEEFDDYFIAALSIRLSGRLSVAVNQDTRILEATKRKKLKNRYWQREYVEVQDAHEFNTYQSYNESFFFEGDLLS